MKFEVIEVNWWHHNPKYVGYQPPPLEQQLKEKVGEFLRKASNIKIISIQQSLAGDMNHMIGLLTIFYE